jgi:hypothetical protein
MHKPRKEPQMDIMVSIVVMKRLLSVGIGDGYYGEYCGDKEIAELWNRRKED